MEVQTLNVVFITDSNIEKNDWWTDDFVYYLLRGMCGWLISSF